MTEPLKYTSEGVPKNWDGKDWQQYKWAMQIVFKKKKLMKIVTGNVKRSDLTSNEAEEEFDDKQLTIMQIIGMSLPGDIFHQVRDKDTGSEMWEALCVIYESRANKTTMAHRAESIRHELEMLKLTRGGDVNQHMSKMFNLRAELLSLNYQFDDITMVELMLNSLPHQYEFESLKSGVRYNSADTFVTPERVRELIRVADSRQKAYNAKRGGKNDGNGGDQKSKTSGTGEKQHGSKSTNSQKKKLKKCFICESTDHLRADCPDKTTPAGGTQSKGSEQQRRPRGNVTILRDDGLSSSLERTEVDVETVTAGLDAIAIDAGIEVAVSGDDEGEDVVVEGEELDELTANTASGWWYFDTAANVHVTGNRAYYSSFSEDITQSQSVHGVTPALATRIAGVGTVCLVTEVNGELIVVNLNDVFYVPGAEYGLFSPGLAAEQGFEFNYDSKTMNFLVTDQDHTVIMATPHDATWRFHVEHLSKVENVIPRDNFLVNFTAGEGVATLERWHERLAHTCPQYLKTMVDKGLVRGMMLTRRQLGVCDACHIGKQKQKPHRKKLDRKLKKPNQVVYADLLIPSKANGTRYEAVLVILDGFSRFVTIHLLTSKDSSVVNKHMMEYVMWAERQAGRGQNGIERIVFNVQQVLTDKGGEFVNGEMKNWYAAHGIEHVLVGPKSSQLNLCERTHQSLVGMMKSMMHQAGFPRSFWPEALKNAVYIKNRVYNKGTDGIPYEMMFGVKPDVHHIRKFGSLAYVHVPVTPGRRKHHDNAKLGFVLGYDEDVVGCKVFFPDEHTAKFVPDLRVAEDVMYRDRHDVLPEDSDLESLHFKPASALNHEYDSDESSKVTETLEMNNSQTELKSHVDTVAASEMNETMNLHDMELERGEECAATESYRCHKSVVDGVTAEIPSVIDGVTGTMPSNDSVCVADTVGDEQDIDMTDSLRSELLQSMHSSKPGSERGSKAVSTSIVSCDGSESVTAVCGSIAEQGGNEDDHVYVVDDDRVEDDEAVTVASVFAETNDSNQGETERILSSPEIVDASTLIPPRQTGKRPQRDETRSEEINLERDAEKPEPKRKRPGLRESSECRRPSYLGDYVMNAVQSSSRVIGKDGRPIRASDVKVPRNHREAMRSKYADFWRMAELEEMAALKAKGVIKMIDRSEMPEDAKPIRTGWVYAVKSDYQGYVIRFKGRTVAFGNHQRPGIDFRDTFSPVARMSSFRLLVALAAALGLDLYGGDVNTAYLNAVLKIRQYLHSIDGFPCEIDGKMFVVLKALYGLRQSGREWNSELNQWLLDRGYLRSLTEPCLYYRFDGESVMLVLIYVDDILVATNDEECKTKLFNDLDDAYGIKDQGLLTNYLGVEIDQSAERITIRQSKYAHEILERFGYENAHSVGNPMEGNARLVPLAEGDSSDTSFAYREAIGMLMYLATSTRPDLAYALGQLSRFVANPTGKHVGAVKRVLRYLAGTLEHGITYERQREATHVVMLEGYCDSDWANDAETRKSTTGFVFTLAGGAISWMSRRQSIVALSTAEAEYVAACEAVMEAVAESNILQEILPKRAVKLRIGIDNQAAHTMATNPTYSRRTRHIELRWHYVREQVEKGAVELHKVKGDVNPADAFTKPLDKRRLKTLLDLVGVGAGN